MKEKGFTLIELLAVIVILAIIALIATPIVLSIISDSKESASLRSAEMYLSSAQQAISIEKMNNINFNPKSCNITSEGNLYCDNKDMVKVEVNGQKPKNGTIGFEEGKIKEVKLVYENAIIIKNSENKLVKTEAESLDNYEHKLKDGTIESHDTENGTCSKCGEFVLAPGLYDSNGVMTLTWQELTSTEYKSFTYIDINGNEKTSGILSIDEDGILTSAFDCSTGTNKSNAYLVGKLVLSNEVVSIREYAFYGCTNLTSVIIPNSIVSIPFYAFGSCINLSSITIPDNVTSIGEMAFESCTSLTTITIPNSVTIIDNYAFAGCENLTSIIIPDSVTSIDDEAFGFCTGLTTIIIPDSVTSINSGVFRNCANLTTVTIPDSVTSIGETAFVECYDLKTINFLGTKQQWNEIPKDERWNLYCPEITVHCTDGDIIIPENNDA